MRKNNNYVICHKIRSTIKDLIIHSSKYKFIFSRFSIKIFAEPEFYILFQCLQITATVECLRDLTSSVEIKASSRQAMVGSLVDGSTETFWESGDEDRNKTKSLIFASSPHHHPRMVCLHIDNCRDLAVSEINLSNGLRE